MHTKKHLKIDIEGLQHLIVGTKVGAEPWYSFLRSAKFCAFRELMTYQEPATTKRCNPQLLPDQYILVITREGERGRTLLNNSYMVDWLKMHFDLPVILPELKYGCRYSSEFLLRFRFILYRRELFLKILLHFYCCF